MNRTRAARSQPARQLAACLSSSLTLYSDTGIARSCTQSNGKSHRLRCDRSMTVCDRRIPNSVEIRDKNLRIVPKEHIYHHVSTRVLRFNSCDKMRSACYRLRGALIVKLHRVSRSHDALSFMRHALSFLSVREILLPFCSEFRVRALAMRSPVMMLCV